jgi:hypothetical protein
MGFVRTGNESLVKRCKGRLRPILLASKLLVRTATVWVSIYARTPES